MKTILPITTALCLDSRRLATMLMALMMTTLIWGQTEFTEPTKVYLMHSSGNHLEMGDDGGGWIESPTKSNPQMLTIIPDGKGYYNIQAGDEQKFLSFASPWNSKFIVDSTLPETKYTIEQASGHFVKLRCLANDR